MMHDAPQQTSIIFRKHIPLVFHNLTATDGLSHRLRFEANKCTKRAQHFANGASARQASPVVWIQLLAIFSMRWRRFTASATISTAATIAAASIRLPVGFSCRIGVR